VQRFLRENWVWLIAPVVVVVAVLLLFAFFGADDGVEPFVYPIF
jgi:ABC-type dipeptide/oligopeptide/nickel transport system permease subunit